jgi:hypothetical protein
LYESIEHEAVIAIGRDVLKEDPMSEICPFCWSKNVKRVGPRPKNGASRADRNLLECQDCEKWFWAGTEEEVPTLFLSCQTAYLHPRKCYPEVLEVALSGGSGFPKRRWAEFNHLCADCPNGRYVQNQCVFQSPEAPSETAQRRIGLTQSKED